MATIGANFDFHDASITITFDEECLEAGVPARTSGALTRALQFFDNQAYSDVHEFYPALKELHDALVSSIVHMNKHLSELGDKAPDWYYPA